MTKTTLDRIETDLIPEAENAAQKGNIQRAINALIDTLKHLLDHAKETNESLERLSAATASEAKTEAKAEVKEEKPKKAAPKKAGGEPTPDVLKPVEG